MAFVTAYLRGRRPQTTSRQMTTSRNGTGSRATASRTDWGHALGDGRPERLGPAERIGDYPLARLAGAASRCGPVRRPDCDRGQR
jgi:hypothetical protein